MPDASARTLGHYLTRPWLLAAGFVAVHLLVVIASVQWTAHIYGDVNLYHWWMFSGFDGGQFPVLDFDWIYPAAALVPMTLPYLIAPTLIGYRVAWVVLVILLNALATVWLARSTPRGRAAAWWWLVFLGALGPIWMGRLDGVIAPLIVIAILEARRRPALAVAIATFGAWIKIAPGALVLLIAAASRRVRDLLRSVVVPGAAVSGAVIGLALLSGAGSRAFSVFGEQAGRGLQAESVAATWFSLTRLWNPGVQFTYNQEIFTFEVLGPVASGVAAALDVLLIASVAGIAALVWLIGRRNPAAVNESVLVAAVAMMAALIVFNKVGSPQFIAWLGAALAPGLALTSGRRSSSEPCERVETTDNTHDQRLSTRRFWLTSSLLTLGIAALTQVIYPIAYTPFINGAPWMVLIGAARNVGVVALLVLAVWQLVVVSTGSTTDSAKPTLSSCAQSQDPLNTSHGSCEAPPEPAG